jgi:tetratricopeptide (TPR) repeat protein
MEEQDNELRTKQKLRIPCGYWSVLCAWIASNARVRLRRMKILNTGLPFGTPGEALTACREKSAHDIRLLSAAGTGDYVFGPEDTAASIIASMAEDWTPDMLICWCPEASPPPRGIEGCPALTAAVVSDWTVYYPQIAQNLSRYDVVLTDRAGAETLQVFGAKPEYITPIYAHRPGIHERRKVEKDIDICFAGNLNNAVHLRRGALLEKIAALSDGCRIVITSDLPPEQYSDLLNRSRIAFNYALRHEMNLRCFEAMACHALLFLEAENLEARDWLEDGESAVFYEEETLVPLLEKYLAVPETCAAMADRAAERLAGELAPAARFDRIVAAVAERGRGPRPFHDLAEADQAMAEVMQFASARIPWMRDYAGQRLAAAAARWPEDWRWEAALGCMAMEAAAYTEGAGKRACLREALDRFRETAVARPDSVPPWLNLAFAARRAGNTEAEIRFLELALNAGSREFDAFLIGERNDRFYGQYREAMARGDAGAEGLHAAAACRLAELRLEEGDLESADKLAHQSSAWMPAADAPWRIRGRVEARRGNRDAAIVCFETGLPLTAFHAEHRRELIALYREAGREEEARELAAISARIFGAWPNAAQTACEFEALGD